LLRNGVVLAEVALAFVLLIGSGLMMRSFVTLYQTQPGFRSEGVLTFLLPNLGATSADAARAATQQIAERLAAVPGVTAVSATSSLPLEGFTGNVRWGTEAALADPTLFQQADVRFIRANYFDVMGTRLVDGRVFVDGETVQDSSRTLIVVDEAFARKAFPGTSAIGKRVLSRTGGSEPSWHEIIGVVQHQRDTSLAADSRETMYFLDAGFGGANRWILRTSADPAVVGLAARSELRSLNRSWIVANLRPLTELVDDARAPTRFALLCIAVFAIVAAVLASVGLYGVLATSVRQRTAEIGVRMAFGADANRIFKLVVRQGLVLAFSGVVLGVAAAIGMTRLIRTMLVGVGATDPTTFAVVAMLFLALAAFASWVPARRAARLEPLAALREE
jgi:putative ABC transport system permease protein